MNPNDGTQISDCLRMESLQGGAEGILKEIFSFGGARYIDYLDSGDGFTVIYVCQSVSKCAL